MNEDAIQLKYLLEAFLTGGDFNLYEDGVAVSTVERAAASVEVSFGKAILSCWGEGWSRSWRVVSVEESSGGLRVGCVKQMGRATCRLDLTRGPDGPGALSNPPESAQADMDRRAFSKRLGTIVESGLPAITVTKALAGRDDDRHISGCYLRLVLSSRGSKGMIAGIGASPFETQVTVDGVLSAGAIWAGALGNQGESVRGLYFFVPDGMALTAATRLTAMSYPGLETRLYEVDYGSGNIRLVEPFDQGDLSDNYKRASRGALWPDSEASMISVQPLVDSVRAIAGSFMHARARGGSVLLSIRGLQFARISLTRRKIYFGLDGRETEMTDATMDELRELVDRIISLRTPYPEDRNSPIYRSYGERWLESMIARDPAVVDPNIDTRFIYSQVPTYRGEQRTFIDLLAVTGSGRLVVMELKISEEVDFPLQALDYCLRVDWHRRRGDFARRGYFPEVDITDESPLLYLVAPLFRFHAMTRLVARAIDPRIPVTRIGINDDWRSGVRVLLRERLNDAC